VSEDDDDLVFLTSDAQLLRFPAGVVRPQGRPASGVAGVRLGDRQHAVYFGVVAAPDDAVVVTVSTSSLTIAGTDPGRAKVSAYADFPAKGRATGGVRAHAFLKGEDTLALAWVGPSPALAVGADGGARDLPEILARRDASGSQLSAPVEGIGSARF
jgi:DNA gyrase subunit A